MQLPAIVHGVPRVTLALVPVAAVLLTVGAVLATSGSSRGKRDTAPPTVAVSVASQQPAPTLAATVYAAPPLTQPANRTDCGAIRGTDYRSSEERDWFLKSCRAAAAAVSSDSASVSGGSGNSGQVAQAASGPATVGGSEYALGDRLVIPAIGVDTSVNGIAVASDGQMATPTGYFNALWYDFKSFPGMGGYVDKGNLVLAGHVDCARCHSGASGAAVFYNMRNLKAGDSIQYRTSSGQQVNYVITLSEWYLPTANWDAPVASRAADMTIITCIGTFDTSRREYTHRLVVQARKA